VAHTYSSRGIFTVELTVTDDAGGVSRMNLTVSVLDRPPAIISASPITAHNMTTGKSVIFSVDARDPDVDSLNFTWTVDGKAVGGNIESFTYKPTMSGTHVIAVSVSDGEQTVPQEWTVTVKAVENPNDALSLVPLVIGILFVVLLAATIAVVAIGRRRPA
jgi:PKD repeat protein